ncbi:hypothetical protein [Acidianus sp. RZ1]|uniref:hypothetical protein n=1 Tax=Acidianus sp. RZ1 TaxID=1540082 RepID=UPI001492ED64|nr:hypothetical protein [Acidianus sp. RZ1]NON61742.1 hypothetical protein [Acidianus sp. RZ1]
MVRLVASVVIVSRKYQQHVFNSAQCGYENDRDFNASEKVRKKGIDEVKELKTGKTQKEFLPLYFVEEVAFHEER